MSTAKSTHLNNSQIVSLLRAVSAVYELHAENPFKIRAYETAADTVEHLSQELVDIWQERGIKGIRGIGPSIGSHLDELFRSGHSKHFDEVFKDIPKSFFVLLEVPGIGPKKAYKLVTELKLDNEKTIVEDLKKAAAENKIAVIPSFGKKSQEVIVAALSVYGRANTQKGRLTLPIAQSLARDIVSHLQKHKGIQRIDPMGSLRRMNATIGDIDIAVMADRKYHEEIVKLFLEYPKKLKIENAGEQKASIIISTGTRVDLRVQEPDTYGSMLQYFTGNKAHNIALREYALSKGYSLSEYGMKEVHPVRDSDHSHGVKHKEKLHTFKNEEDLYGFLGLQYIPPELREGVDEIEIAKHKKIPTLVEKHDIKGELHIHSSYDLQSSHDIGADDYETLVKKAVELKYDYIGFADHNPRQSGNTPESIAKILKTRRDYIDKKLKHSPIPYFLGLEVDILPSGQIAFPEQALPYVDFLIVSIHSSFDMGIDMMTKRVLTALSMPKVRVLGHPTGRLLMKREGYELLWEEIFAHCKKHDIALEINSSYERLDLPDRLVHMAVEKGVSFVIDTDAHAASHMEALEYGVSVARRGWCEKKNIMNTLPYSQFKKWLVK